MNETMLEQEELLEDASRATEEDAVAAEQNEERPPEKNMGATSSQVALQIMSLVYLHVGERKLGKVFGSDCGYQMPGDDAKKARFPDGSFVARGRLPDERTPEGNLKLVPDLALEVVSPNDTAYEVEEKRVAYLKAGVRLVWIVFPPTRTVFVFRPGGKVAVLGEANTVTGEDVLADFSCPVARFFEDL
jgi:Uma2 family endonuclease